MKTLSSSSWKVSFLPEALEELGYLEGSVRPIVNRAIVKLQNDPLPAAEGGWEATVLAFDWAAESKT